MPTIASLAGRRVSLYAAAQHPASAAAQVFPPAATKNPLRAETVTTDWTTSRPSRFPEVADRPNLRKLLAEQVDMQMDDVTSMLALPRHDLGLSGGCNLALTGLLSNVISGCSVLLARNSRLAGEQERAVDAWTRPVLLTVCWLVRPPLGG
jgi:hypothetical protein